MFKEAFDTVKSVVAKGAGIVGIKDDDLITGITICVFVLGGAVVAYILAKQ